jgi:kynurenine formamidase
MATTRKLPTAADISNWCTSLSNWGRWGKDDQLGTMNLITPAKRLEAAKLIKKGITVTLARPIVNQPAADDEGSPPLLYMVESGEGWNSTPGKPELEGKWCAEFIGMVYHGFSITHVDSLCHIFMGDKMYNGFPADLVRTRFGATAQSVDLLKNGVVSRGVLFDFPTLKGVPYMQAGEAVFPEDLDEAEKRFNVKVEPGDVLLIRTGNWERRNALGPKNPAIDGASGLHAACLPWLRQRDIAMVGSDLATDVMPSGYKELHLPLHQVLIPVMGCCILDNCNLENLARTCAEENRYEFLVVVNPLRLANGTGGPVNPIAMF